MQRAEVIVAGMRVAVNLSRRGHDLWAASGEFADREIVVLARTLDAALDRWRMTAADDWSAAA